VSAAPPRGIEAIRHVLSRATGTGWEAAYRQDVGVLLEALDEAVRQLAARCPAGCLSHPSGFYELRCNALSAERDEARRERDEAADKGAKDERAAVVAWLRTRERQIENWPPGGMNEISLTYNIIATSIERGEHRREEEP
jgi:hypothetical protein